MEITIKILIDLICGSLSSWGGYSWHNARRFFMPILLALTFGFVTHIWWIGISVLPVIGTLCLGYFFRGNQGLQWLGRGLWLALQALVLAFVTCITGHLAWFFYVPYVLVA